MFGYGRIVRMPPPPKRAGFKQKASYYHRKKGLQGSVPVRVQIEGRPRTRHLRRDFHRRAGLLRSPWRWMAVFGTWGVLGLGAWLEPLSRMSVYHFVLGLSAAAVWPAAFALNPLNRAVASLVLLVGGVTMLALGGPVPVGAMVGFLSVALFLGTLLQLTPAPRD